MKVSLFISGLVSVVRALRNMWQLAFREEWGQFIQLILILKSHMTISKYLTQYSKVSMQDKNRSCFCQCLDFKSEISKKRREVMMKYRLVRKKHDSQEYLD